MRAAFQLVLKCRLALGPYVKAAYRGKGSGIFTPISINLVSKPALTFIAKGRRQRAEGFYVYY